MVEEQQKAVSFHSEYYERNYSFEQVFSYQIVSLAVTEILEVTK